MALVLGACGALAPAAFTVEGTRVSQQSIDDELSEIRDNAKYREAIQLTKDQSGRDLVIGEGKGTFRAELAAQVVSQRLYYTIIEREVKRRNLSITSADLTRAKASFISQVNRDPQTGQPTPGLGEKVLGAFSKSYQDTLIRREANLEKLQGVLTNSDVSPAAVKRYFDEHQEDFAQVCAKHILVDTLPEAQQVKADLSGGADFGQEAAGKSKDPSAKDNKGDLGCASPDGYVPEFAAAVKTQKVGEIGEPVQTQFGFHVIQVYERKLPALADVEQQIVEHLSQQGRTALFEFLTKALTKADITVNPKFGRFARKPAQGECSSGLPCVVPPEAPPPPTGRVTTTEPIVVPTTTPIEVPTTELPPSSSPPSTVAPGTSTP